ncbi:MAG: winged helix-turn-helix transcriptional regulator [Candidatus Aenigmarchaeota archaeon]|nr:winged helix-turn-helix transcriptional regulator [Candidatus Aenigmarchaeota archaeon]
MSNAAQEVLRVLSSSSSISQKEIKNRTGLSIRSVKGSLKLLREENIVKEIAVFEDMRRKRYVLRVDIDER